MDYCEMGQRVRSRRMQLGWTQERLAKEIGVSTSFVGHIERGSRKASLETLVQLCNALDISADALLEASLDRERGLLGKPESCSERRTALRELLSQMQRHLDTWNEED